MDSSTRAEFEETTPECESILSSPLRERNVNSLLCVDENHNIDRLKDVSQGAAVKSTDTSLSEQKRFLELPVLYAATILERDNILKFLIDFLIGKNPQLLVEKTANNADQDCLIVPMAFDTEQLIDVLEIVGVACIFNGGIGRRHGMTFWKEAIILRQGKTIPKTLLHKSQLEELVFMNKSEVNSLEELNTFSRETGKFWKVQAFFVCKRILKKYGCFPNAYVMKNLYKFTLRDWSLRGVHGSCAFAFAIYFIEIFGSAKSFKQLVNIISTEPNHVHLTLTNLLETLGYSGYPEWIEKDLSKPTAVLTFDHLFPLLEFACKYQLRIHDLNLHDAAKKKDEISRLVLRILKLLVVVPKTIAQGTWLKNQTECHIYNYEKLRTKNKESLLLRACQDYNGQTSDFDLIELLLKVHADTNAVNENSLSPLHLLARNKCSNPFYWRQIAFKARARRFYHITRTILNGHFIKEQRDDWGRSALEFFAPSNVRQQYPLTEFRILLDNFYREIPPNCSPTRTPFH